MTNSAKVAALYQAFGRGDIPSIIEQVSEDVVWERSEVDHGIPWLKPGRGRAHVQRFFESLGALTFNAFQVQNILEGANQVVALVRCDLTVKDNGRRIVDEEAHVWTFDAAGRIIGFRHIADTLVHQRAITSA